MVLDPIPQILFVHFFGSRPQYPPLIERERASEKEREERIRKHDVTAVRKRLFLRKRHSKSLLCRSLMQKSPTKETCVLQRDTARVSVTWDIQSIAFGVSFNLNLQSQSPWSLFNGTWQKRPRKLDDRLRSEIEEMTLQMQQTVPLILAPFLSFSLSLSLCRLRTDTGG